MWLTALIMGMAGSLHCIGMCSPLAMAATNLTRTAIANRVLYNAGRIITYGILGGAMASIGYIIPIFRFQATLSILLGLALLFIGVTGISGIHLPFITDSLTKFSGYLKKIFGRYLKKKNHVSVFILGSLNGLLPCGLTFLALTYCLTLESPFQGLQFMALFGIATLPAMLGFTSLIYWVVKRFNFSMQKISTAMLILSGIILIVRVFIVHLPHVHSGNETMMDIVICK